MKKPFFDLCVVGTGPSSFAVVSSFIKTNKHAKVLVLEAGPKRFTESPLGDRRSVATPFRLNPTINIGYGGTSQLWHNILAPLDEDDFEENELSQLSGWPIEYSTLEPHYRKVAEFFGFNFEVFHEPHKFFDLDSGLSDIRFNSDVFEPKIFIHPLKYLRCDRQFENLCKRHQNLDVRLGAQVVRYSDFENHVEVQCVDVHTAREKTYLAKKFVLCAGALNNPEILFNSGCRQKGLSFVGKCLMDHPMGNMFQFRYPSKISAPLYSSQRFKRRYNVKVALRIHKTYRSMYRLPNSAFYLRPAFSEGVDDKTEELRLNLLTIRKKIKSFRPPFRELASLATNANLIRQVLLYKTGLSSMHDLSECMLVTEQLPNVDSEIRLSNQQTSFGTCKTEVAWSLTDQDIGHVEVLGNLIHDNLVIKNGAELTSALGSIDWLSRLSSAAHHLGTVRMSKTAETGCVDGNLKLHISDKVYVCDGSVFPTSGNANPTFTCMALGDRLGEYLANE